jgi:hypothetical protein
MGNMDSRTTRKVGAAISCLLAAVTASGQQVKQRSTEAILIERISSLPAEYKADLGFALLESTSLNISPKKRSRLITDIFESADGAKFPYEQIDASHKQLSLSHLNEVNLQYSKLNTLDIQAEAVRLALAQSPALGQSLFQKVSLAAPNGYGCEVHAIANVGAFYDLVGLMMKDDRVTAIANSESRPAYLTSLTSSMNAPVELVPMGALILHTKTSDAIFATNVQTYANSMSRMTATDREMSVIEDNGQLTSTIGALAARLKSIGVSPRSLIEAYVNFLERSLHAERCSDYSFDRAKTVLSVNGMIQSELQMPDGTVPFSLKNSDVEATSTKTVADEPTIPIPMFLSPQIQRITQVHTANVLAGVNAPMAEPVQPEAADVDTVMDWVIAQPSERTDCYLCAYEDEDTVLLILTSNLPPGPALNRAISTTFDGLLINNQLREDNPPEWIKVVRMMLNITRVADESGKRVMAEVVQGGYAPLLPPNPDALEIKRLLASSSDPIIVTYYLQDQALKTPYSATSIFRETNGPAPVVSPNNQQR